jgi:mannosyl-oligosaccharide alpha-1,2-mannosidase
MRPKVACFYGGNFILGGLVLSETRYVDFGLELTKSCRETYLQTATGLGPELFQWQDNATAPDAWNNGRPPDDQIAFYKKAGFWIVNGQYVLRPEVIESYYYAYRATGDETYRDWAWEAFEAINKTCSIGSGFSSIANVQPVNGTVEYYDFQESFWFAEVMKYSYMIQMEGDADVHVKKDGKNKFVFNTEAHPVAVSGAYS